MRWLDARKVRRQLRFVATSSPNIECELVGGINFDGFLRKVVREEIVGPAKIVIAETLRPNITDAQQIVLEREAALAALACATVDDHAVQINGREALPSWIVVVAEAMIQIEIQAAETVGNMGRAIPVSYSNLPDDALSQLIVAWGVALKIDSPDFRSIVFKSKMLENWGALRSIVGVALTIMGRVSYKQQQKRAVKRVVEMPAQQRRLALQAIEHIATNRQATGASHRTQAKPADGPAIGSPIWKKANAIFFISSSALMEVQGEIDNLWLKWIDDHPFDELPWKQVLGANEKAAGLIGVTLFVDSTLLSHTVVLGVAASREPKFFNCRLHKELQSMFIKTYAEALQLGEAWRGLFPSQGGGEPKPYAVDEGKAGVETLKRIRTAAWYYADPKRPASSDAERLARLTGGTVLLRQMVGNHGCQPFIFGFLSLATKTASARISALINEYRATST